MENNAAAVAKCLADHFVDIALNIGGQHAYDLFEEDHKYHTSIASISKKYHDAAAGFQLSSNYGNRCV